MPVDSSDLYKDLIEFELNHIREYAHSVERFFSAEFDSHAKYVADMSAKLTPEQREQFVDVEVDGYWMFGELLLGMMRSSLLTHSYSFFEYHLLNICHGFYRREELRLSPKALRDEGIFRARTYLKKVVGIDFPDDAPSWKEITTLNVIRNIIVHGDGHVSEDNPKRAQILEYLRQKQSGSLDHLGRFQFSDKFISDTLNLYQTFFDELFRRIASRS